jgi:hypothetical protein
MRATAHLRPARAVAAATEPVAKSGSGTWAGTDWTLTEARGGVAQCSGGGHLLRGGCRLMLGVDIWLEEQLCSQWRNLNVARYEGGSES